MKNIEIGDLIEYKHTEDHWERGIVVEINKYGDIGIFLFSWKDKVVFSNTYKELRRKRVSIGKMSYSSDKEYTDLRLIAKANYEETNEK